jgi:hypothetical protein
VSEFKLTQKDQLIRMFHANEGSLTLGQIMATTLGCEYRARISELRREGFRIVCEKGKRPSENRYTLLPSQPDLLKVA